VVEVGEAAAAVPARYGRGPLYGAIVVAGSWHIVNDLVGTLMGWQHYRSTTVVAGVWLVYAAIGIAVVASLLRGVGPGTLASVLAVLVLMVGSAAQTAACSPELTFTLANWAWVNFGWFAILVLWRRPVAWLFVSFGANVMTTLLTLLATRPVDRVDLARFATVMYGASAIQLAIAWGSRVLERRIRRAALASIDRAAITTARVAAESVHSDRQRRYREIGEAVHLLLAALAAGNLDPRDPVTQRRCAVEASRLRRLIAERDDVPNPLLHELRACADVAERRGVTVSFEVAGVPAVVPVEARRVMSEAPVHVLAAACTEARLTVLWSPDGDVEISVVADAQADEPRLADQDVDVTWRQEGDALWVRTRWHGG